MIFWDSSALVPLLIRETETERCQDWLKSDPDMLVWYFSPLECLSAYFRRHRNLENEKTLQFKDRLTTLRQCWNEVQAQEIVRARAERIIALHDLRAADALQLAAALVACEERPERISFASFDKRLSDAALREGFTVLK